MKQTEIGQKLLTKYQKLNINMQSRILWLYLKYQIITKLIIGLIILPIFNLIFHFLLTLSGRTNLSSGDFLDFFLSFYGIPVIILGIILLIIMLGLDINTFIIISALAEEKKLKITIKQVLINSLHSIKTFFSPIGIFLVFYIALILPLVGLKINLNLFKNFKIPNFITSVIFNSSFYSTLYTGILIFLSILSIVYIFTIHFIILEKQNTCQALKKSRQLIQKHWKNIFKDYLIKIIKLSLASAILLLIFLSSTFSIEFLINFFFNDNKISLIILTLSTLEFISLLTFMIVPITISFLTQIFYKYQFKNSSAKTKFIQQAKSLKLKNLNRKFLFKTKLKISLLLILTVLINFGIAFLFANDFEEFFPTKVKINLVAHRGGGDLAAENSLQGIKLAAKNGAKWTEIDVQRTKDNHYIINHDASFSRLANDSRKPNQLTLAEIEKIKIKNLFKENQTAQPVPTLEQVIDASKNKIGVLIELKGETADQKMVDDVVKMIKQRNMLKQTAILSLDYKIIEYTEQKYPEIQTGYLYYFAFGQLHNLKGNFLIMEEREATAEKIDEIHHAGKKAIVWTVNTDQSIKKFINSDVDGIITDHVLKVKQAIKTANKRSRLQIILDKLIVR